MKPVDGCDKSFRDLAKNELPRYFSRLKKNMKSPFRASWLLEGGTGRKKILRHLDKESDFLGCYVSIENGKPLYVGISRKVISRLSQQLKSSDHFGGSLAYYMAKVDLQPRGTREQNMDNTKFRRHFVKAKERLRKCDIAWVEIDNPVELYLFEVYAAMELGTGEYNTFRTHRK